MLFVAIATYAQDTTYFYEVAINVFAQVDSVRAGFDTVISEKNYDSVQFCSSDTCYWTFQIKKDTTFTPNNTALNSRQSIDITYSLFDSKNDSFIVSVEGYNKQPEYQCHTYPTGNFCTVVDSSCSIYPEDSVWGNTNTRPGINKKLYAAAFKIWDSVGPSCLGCPIRLKAIRASNADTTYFYLSGSAVHQYVYVNTINSIPQRATIKSEISITQTFSTVTFLLAEKVKDISIYNVRGQRIASSVVNNNIAVWHRTVSGRYFVKAIYENKTFLKGFTVVE